MNKETENPAAVKKVSVEDFAGSATCVNCHKNIAENHINTAHHLTSQPATEKSIKGNFDPGKNKFAFNKSVVVAMEKRDSGFYQVEYYKEVEKKARRFDIIVGSGTMGQSSLYWASNRLFQLPITYFTAANEWSNSPGFPDKVVYNRAITSRCLECHTTYVETVSAPQEQREAFNRSNILFGVDCEKCHGPAKAHVKFKTENPKETIAKYIINPAKLSRQQSLDLCALCHGGRLQKTTLSFEFTAGDTLANHFEVDTSAPNPENIDVHGNQYGLLRASECFRKSANLTCNTCHNTHENERGKTALFSQRCISCHTNSDHRKLSEYGMIPGAVIKQNCIDCHMPEKPSRAIAVFLPEKDSPTAALVRSHFISIYPDETKKQIARVKEFK